MYSLTYTGAILMLLTSVLSITQTEAETWLKVTSIGVSFLIALYGRWRIGGINLLGWKK